MNVADLRSELGLSQEEFAKLLGLKSKGYISDIERGRPVALRLAMKIERLSNGRVAASDISPEAADIARPQ